MIARAERLMHIGSDDCRVLLSGHDTEQRLCMLEWEGRSPGGPPLHLHEAQDEVFMIETGDYSFQLGGQILHLGPGDTLFVPRGTPHAFRQNSASGRLRYLYTPAGCMEAFFSALAELPGPPQPAQAEAMFQAHGMRLLGAPLV